MAQIIEDPEEYIYDAICDSRFKYNPDTQMYHYSNPLFPNKNYNWSAFILNKYIFDIVGEFDEGFSRCYFEDNDYAYRVKLANMHIKTEPLLNAEVYRNSMTIQKDPFLSTFAENQKYYITKWGGMPEQETYTIPFNQI